MGVKKYIIAKKREIEDIDTDETCKLRSWLLDETNLHWRVSVMKQSGLDFLLKDHWTEAVDFFIQHATAQDELKHLTNVHDVRRYFANFCRETKATGQALKEHLHGINLLSKYEVKNEDNKLWY